MSEDFGIYKLPEEVLRRLRNEEDDRMAFLEEAGFVLTGKSAPVFSERRSLPCLKDTKGMANLP